MRQSPRFLIPLVAAGALATAAPVQANPRRGGQPTVPYRVVQTYTPGARVAPNVYAYPQINTTPRYTFAYPSYSAYPTYPTYPYGMWYDGRSYYSYARGSVYPSGRYSTPDFYFRYRWR